MEASRSGLEGFVLVLTLNDRKLQTRNSAFGVLSFCCLDENNTRLEDGGQRMRGRLKIDQAAINRLRLLQV
jgi:hypothetical protein